MPELEDMRLFAEQLVARRNRAAMLLASDAAGQQAYAEKLASHLQAQHIDVLAVFQKDEKLLARLSYFSDDDLLEWIAQHRDQKLLVISGIEFLLAVWLSQGEPSQVKRTLCQKIEFWQQSPAFLLVIQEDPVFAGYLPERHRGSRIVLPTSHTLAIE